MASIKLARLADRTPTKMAITLAPELAEALHDYGDYYARSYGKAEPLTELIPAILGAFLDSDREFARIRKARTHR